ncbi:hypothetical protein MSBR2_0106 [Methanosarcina barkeri 227]|uniref:Uncharacterized protein n=2 Tax=Methanosarcina barkeri TaxID=2208 RepID=A0A0E3QX41_METBA|nr:hypothetical protein MSBRM_2306 [Methanosarcina barkeri MS]AKB56622.1 hypothetical protein MSBR2_0106 [Methanosarcina barkeri 227]
MQKGQNKEALKALEKAEEAAGQAKEIDIFLYVQTLKGHLMQALLIWGVLKRLNKGTKRHSKLGKSSSEPTPITYLINLT